MKRAALVILILLSGCIFDPSPISGRWGGEFVTPAYTFPVTMELDENAGSVSGRALVTVWNAVGTSEVSGTYHGRTVALALDGAVYWTFDLVLDGNVLRGDGLELGRLP